MNFLVFVETEAGELEKILSGLKSILVKDVDAEALDEDAMQPGDNLYFLRDNDECEVRVKATVVQMLRLEEGPDEELAQMLKEVQPKLQLTEDQYNRWAEKKQAVFIEFEAAQKMEEWQVPPEKVTDRTGWIRLDEMDTAEQRAMQDQAGLKRE